MSGGFRVEAYIPGTQAENAGVEIGDVLVAVNGIDLSDEAVDAGRPPESQSGGARLDHGPARR